MLNLFVLEWDAPIHHSNYHMAFRLVPFKRPKIYKILHQKCCAGMLEEGQISHVT